MIIGPKFLYLMSKFFWILQMQSPQRGLTSINKIQPVVYYQCCILIGLVTTRLYVIAH